MWTDLGELGSQKGQRQEMERLLPVIFYLFYGYETKTLDSE